MQNARCQKWHKPCKTTQKKQVIHKQKLHEDFPAKCQVAFLTMTTSRFVEDWRSEAFLSDWNQQNQPSSLHLKPNAENLLYCIKVRRRYLSTKQRGRDNNSRVSAGSSLQPSSFSSDNSYFCSLSLLFHNSNDEEILFQNGRD